MDANPSKKVSKVKTEVLAGLERLDVSDETWQEIRRQIVQVLADRASDLADQIAEEKGWTDEDFERMAHTHMRTPYAR